MDYEAEITRLKGSIKIRADNRKSTAVLLDRLSEVQTLRIKKEMRDEKKRARERAAR